jgi:ABC-type multidrug transport system ATPase subunit
MIHPPRAERSMRCSASRAFVAMARRPGVSLERPRLVREHHGLDAVAKVELGDPGVLVFDEPLNGLDPDGIRWLRGLLRELAAQDRTVFVSSHLLSEVAQTADEVVVLSRGRLVAQTPLADLVDRGEDLESLFFDLVNQNPPNQETAA